MKNLARAFTFQNHRSRPAGGDQSKLQPPRLSDAYKNRAHSHVAAQNRGFSGPLTALVPIEVRAHNNNNNRKEKERGREGGGVGGGFDSDVEEPRSPKVSCMGQIKQRKKLHKLKREKSKKLQKLETKREEVGAKKNPNSGFGNIFRRKSKSFAAAAMTAEKTISSNPPPGLSQMKRFSSGRDAFANFDWTKQQVAPVDRECYSDDDEQRRDYWDDDDDDEDEEFGGGRNDVMIPFSAPMMIGGGDIQLQPRKEICLWKKRNMQPPKPLKLNTFR